MSQKSTDKPRRGRTSTSTGAGPSAGVGSPAKTNTGGGMQKTTDKPKEDETKTTTNLVGSQTEMDGVLETILARLDKIDGKTDVDNDHKKQQAEYMVGITAYMEENRKEQNKVRRKLLITEQQLRMAKDCNKKLETQMNTLENQAKICNLRIEGKREVEGENMTDFIMDMAKQVGAEDFSPTDLISAERMGRKHNGNPDQRNNRPRMIMATFRTRQARNKIYYGRSKLHNTELFRGIYINDDVSVITRRQRDEYRSVATLARSLGADIRVHDDGIIIDGRKYLLGDAHTLPDKYSLEKAKTVMQGGELYFASQHSFLSNFAYAPIIEGDTLYPSAEHYYQARKCEYANEPEKMQKVIEAPTPLEAKQIADEIKETPEWRGSHDGIMEEVVAAKFAQNKELACKLMETGVLSLNEATHNEHFGIGVAINSRAIKDKSYKGKNKLGKILMNIRDELNAERKRKEDEQNETISDQESEQSEDDEVDEQTDNS